MSAIIKDCGEIWNRLFDHRPFLCGEIKFFVEEFEEKRKDREVSRLFEVLERVTEIRDTQIDKVKALSSANLSTLQSNLDLALEKCNTILDNETNFNVDIALEGKREIRKAEWEVFTNYMGSQYQTVDDTFADKETELKQFYVDLEQKLHIDD